MPQRPLVGLEEKPMWMVFMLGPDDLENLLVNTHVLVGPDGPEGLLVAGDELEGSLVGPNEGHDGDGDHVHEALDQQPVVGRVLWKSTQMYFKLRVLLKKLKKCKYLFKKG